MKKELKAFIVCTIILSMSSVAMAANYTYTPQNTYSNLQSSESLQGKVTYVPAGTITSVMLTSELNSSTITVGSTVNVTLVEDFIYKDKIIAQKGSIVSGTVIKARKAGAANRNGQIQVVFNNISTPQGYNIPINAVFKTDDNSGILKGGTSKDAAIDYAKNTAIGAGAGAVLGTAMGPLSGGSVGKGAIYGTAIGGGLGIIKGLADKGDDISIPQSAQLDIYFTQPITISAPTEYRYDY